MYDVSPARRGATARTLAQQRRSSTHGAPIQARPDHRGFRRTATRLGSAARRATRSCSPLLSGQLLRARALLRAAPADYCGHHRPTLSARSAAAPHTAAVDRCAWWRPHAQQPAVAPPPLAPLLQQQQLPPGCAPGRRAALPVPQPCRSSPAAGRSCCTRFCRWTCRCCVRAAGAAGALRCCSRCAGLAACAPWWRASGRAQQGWPRQQEQQRHHRRMLKRQQPRQARGCLPMRQGRQGRGPRLIIAVGGRTGLHGNIIAQLLQQLLPNSLMMRLRTLKGVLGFSGWVGEARRGSSPSTGLRLEATRFNMARSPSRQVCCGPLLCRLWAYQGLM